MVQDKGHLGVGSRRGDWRAPQTLVALSSWLGIQASIPAHWRLGTLPLWMLTRANGSKSQETSKEVAAETQATGTLQGEP